MPQSGTASLPQGVVTFLMTDIEASTRHWSRHGDAMERALPRHDDILREHIRRCSGHVLKHRNRGDSFFAVFDRASDAVNAAAAFQRELQREDWEQGVALRVRTGIHSGEAVLREGDYYGDAVNRCSRLCDVAHGGQIVVTAATRSLCDGSADEDIRFRPLGPQLLEGLDERVEVFQLVHPELSSDFPLLRTRENVPNNLPRSLSSFVGRASELDFLKGLIKKSRLVTLVGPGGVGKTRLAIEFGRQHLRGYPGGVWLVQLGGVGADESVADALADAMAVREYGGADSLQAVVNEIGADEALVILDNCEHVRQRGMRCAYELLERCPKLSILATSREPFGVQWEQQFYVPVLDLPPEANGQSPSIDELVRIDAVSLLLERARAFDAGFRITERNRGAVVQLVRMLDGVPLALELVASLVTTLSVRRILDRLQRFPLRDLATLDPTVENRHRSVRLMIEWSYQLLEERERLFFLRLSVFPDSFDLDAAEAICVDGPIEADDVLGLMPSMVRKSLVAKVGNGDGLRYRMLWAIRQFAREEYQAQEERRDRWDRHASYYEDFAHRAELGLVTEEATEWAKRIELELPNHRQSLETLRERGEVERALIASSALWRFWWIVSRYTEGRAEIERCIDAARGSERTAALAQALHGSGTLAADQVDFQVSKERLGAALEIWEALGNEDGMLRSLANLAGVEMQLGALEDAMASYLSCLDIVERKEDERAAAVIRHNLASVYYRLGRYEDAIAAARGSAAYFENGGDHATAAHVVLNLGVILFRVGRPREAIPYFEEALRLHRESGNTLHAGEAMVKLAESYHELGHADRALRTCDEALRAMRRHDSQEFYVRGLRLMAQLKTDAGELHEARRLLRDVTQRLGSADDRESHLLEQHTRMGELDLRDGSISSARSILAEAMHIARRRPAPAEMGDVLLPVADLLLHEGRGEAASHMLTLARRINRDAKVEPTPYVSRKEQEIEARIVSEIGADAHAGACLEAEAWERDRAMREIDALLPAPRDEAHETGLGI